MSALEGRPAFPLGIVQSATTFRFTLSRAIARLIAHLRRARQAVPEPGQALRAVCRAYLDFATERPALYQAMFVLPTDVKFASADTPPPLRAAFGEVVSCFPLDNERRELFAEVTWSALHGMAVLSDSGRIPPDGQEERLDFLVTQIAGSPAG